MGKSGGKKKKPTETPAKNNVVNSNNNNGLMKRANELKEEGNKRFQAKDFIGALEKYENGLKLIPKNDKERAIFHSNRAACLMEMKPIDYNRVVFECSLAIQAHPLFVRALVRRAKAYEALGRFDLALSDVDVILGVESGNCDALEISRRIRGVLLPGELMSRPSPAALGASAVRGAPVGGLGPSLPARPVPKKALVSNGSGNSSKSERLQTGVVVENGHDVKGVMPKVALKLDNGSCKVDEKVVVKTDKGVVRWRQLKLVYDHDIRLAQMPVNCGFKSLREIVGGRFPSSKSVLIKYKDSDGDLVTITCTSELKLAEAFVDGLVPKGLESGKVDSVGMLRLHIVEVDPEQEPAVVEEEEEVAIEIEEVKIDEGHESRPHSSVGDSIEIEAEKTEDKAVEEISKEKKEPLEEGECKEIEMDDWLFEFAQLFRNNVGIDPDAHIELHEVGMELCSEALEETVTSEDAQPLFEKAAQKFQEVGALAYFNWGNVHMCEARKRITVDENAPEEVKAAQLQIAYHWVNEKYSLAREKYEQALSIKPDFYEGLLALAQQQFEMAKLQWSYVMAKKTDLSSWDSSEIFKLFDSAQEKMKTATEMWEKIEEQRANELKDPTSKKTEELLKRRKKVGNDGESPAKVPAEPTPEEQAEQAAVMRSQIHLFWGNMLFERSQIEYRLGVVVWKKNLDTAVARFKLAGASQTDISTVTSNHCCYADLTGGDATKANNVAQVVATEINPEAH